MGDKVYVAPHQTKQDFESRNIKLPYFPNHKEYAALGNSPGYTQFHLAIQNAGFTSADIFTVPENKELYITHSQISTSINAVPGSGANPTRAQLLIKPIKFIHIVTRVIRISVLNDHHETSNAVYNMPIRLDSGEILRFESVHADLKVSLVVIGFLLDKIN